MDDRKVLSGIVHVIQKGLAGWMPLDAPEPPDSAEPEVLMIDATDIKAHPTASSLNKGGMTSKLHGVCHSKAWSPATPPA